MLIARPLTPNALTLISGSFNWHTDHNFAGNPIQRPTDAAMPSPWQRTALGIESCFWDCFALTPIHFFSLVDTLVCVGVHSNSHPHWYLNSPTTRVRHSLSLRSLRRLAFSLADFSFIKTKRPRSLESHSRRRIRFRSKLQQSMNSRTLRFHRQYLAVKKINCGRVQPATKQANCQIQKVQRLHFYRRKLNYVAARELLFVLFVFPSAFVYFY